MSKRLFDHDPITGITEWFEYDESADNFTIQTTQDATELLRINEISRSNFSSGKDRWGEGFDHKTHVARLPMNIYMDLQKRGILRDPKAFKKWLNDPDNYAFRARPGRV